METPSESLGRARATGRCHASKIRMEWRVKTCANVSARVSRGTSAVEGLIRHDSEEWPRRTAGALPDYVFGSAMAAVESATMETTTVESAAVSAAMPTAEAEPDHRASHIAGP